MARLKNLKHDDFARQYVVDFNGTQAAIRAGYSTKAAGQIAFDLLKNPKIQARIDELVQRRNDRLDITGDRVLQELGRIAFASLGDFLEVGKDGSFVVSLAGATPEAITALTEAASETRTVQTKKGAPPEVIRTNRVKTASKIQALAKLGEHLGLWKPEESKTLDAMAAALAEINRRGSSAPIARHRRAR